MKMPGSTSGLLPFSKTPSNNFFFFTFNFEMHYPISPLLQDVAHAFSFFFFFPRKLLSFLLISQLKHFSSNVPTILDWDRSLPCVLSEHSVLFLHSMAFVTFWNTCLCDSLVNVWLPLYTIGPWGIMSLWFTLASSAQGLTSSRHSINLCRMKKCSGKSDLHDTFLLVMKRTFIIIVT